MNQPAIPANEKNESDASRLRRFVFCLTLALGVILAIAGESFEGDPISYLDMGDAFFGGQWQAIFNELWSPLYPFVLGLTRWIFKPSMTWDHESLSSQIS